MRFDSIPSQPDCAFFRSAVSSLADSEGSHPDILDVLTMFRVVGDDIPGS